MKVLTICALLSLSHAFVSPPSVPQRPFALDLNDRKPLMLFSKETDKATDTMTRKEMLQNTLQTSFTAITSLTTLSTLTMPTIANAAPEIFTTERGVKYAITKK
jgi:hypothetical protein